MADDTLFVFACGVKLMSDFPTVTIRGQRSDDWEYLYVLLNEKESIQDSIDDLPYVPEETFRERLNAPASNTHTLIAEAGQPSGRRRIVGVAWLYVQTRRRCYIGRLKLVIHPDYRGSDAENSLLEAALNMTDNWLGLRRTEVIVYAGDESALLFYEQHGFEREAVMRRYTLRAGTYSDARLLVRRRPQTLPAGVGEAVVMGKPVNKEGKLAITIRGMEVEDWEDIAAILSSGNVIYNTLQLPYTSRDFVRERMENLPDDQRVLVAVVRDKVVGQLWLHFEAGRRAHVARLGMMVHAEFQGRGVGIALMEAGIDLAENWLNISRIELECYTDNAAGLALYRKFGFEVEGTLRDYAFRDGHLVDAYLMARVRDEE
jgi:putative acetyltransferase